MARVDMYRALLVLAIPVSLSIPIVPGVWALAVILPLVGVGEAVRGGRLSVVVWTMDASFYERFLEIETPLLRLRELTPDDASGVFEMFRDPEVTQFYDVTTMTDLEQARALTERLRRRFHDRSGIRWAIERKDDRSMIGTCGYPVIAAAANRGSIGYELARRAWGQGFATEAVEAIVGFGHRVMQLHRIDALVMTGNAGSMAVLRKCGFAREGVLRDYAFNGRYHDMEMFAHLDNDTAGAGQPSAPRA